ncbi:SCA7-domain-containing protein [Dichomitus squalens LYAD-421 SS1]|uniref:SCA7, zinc-binding domain-containing protein n=1 Tax=Dichomitus squalens TaxID=114155 RepID=A0A4Q9Q1P4_9APHY|nr:SCA7-domain-containing protein [Dichomitus squalens LYAD-421 SS1]EJF64263.1 SCA7-domain-containing protein [Dichomitus squalens LYAD-421 SS1]TBU60999.1 SCA7, zinc-binding domain-containing protein [Dichomitus squalens]
MPLKIKSSPSPPASPFTWELLPQTPPSDIERPPSPPTSWLSARDMKTFGAQPLVQEVGVVKCKDCLKPVLRSAVLEHADNCAKIRNGSKKGAKGKAAEVEDKKGKKRKAEDEVPNAEDPNAPKTKKQARSRVKGPVDYDKQCGVINDKGLPCSRSLTCKSHSMGSKRAVQGRSKPYDELLLDWNRANNPNWVEPVKKESKAERKERKEREKAEKKRLAMEAAAAIGGDASKKGAAVAVGGTTKKKGKAATVTAATAAAIQAAAQVGPTDDVYENLDDVDSEAELDSLVRAVRIAHDRGVIGAPLAVPCDASSWFVARRERLRTCNHLLANALMPSRNAAVPVVSRLA